ncbi:MAG TPA: DUF2249 domain-containing protein [Casimicrobiaceae bacterium]|nr:DUF2249 domain-containing protein [Casimicrobiaceae bacterium]
MATIDLDVRGLQAPEPLERVLERLDDLGAGDCLRVRIDCHPLPLFRILDRNGYTHEEAPGVDALLEISIRRGTPPAAA